MRHLAVAILASAFLVILCNASCVNDKRLRAARPGPSDNSCLDTEGKSHAYKSTWETSDCMKCNCTETGITCCTKMRRPVLFNPDDCEAVLNKTSCTYQLRRKDNPSESCNITAMI
ncbi:beta-microseminoprotein-like [Bombina bombina]|uniref:beta-microseminoprotein-like n=1 Tax=Bombina bombina TaxID=8345 RepID=UPI00235A5896|nr:beta-microseminoprotein-like [Bombina bombina]